jgi:hypothetical protein
MEALAEHPDRLPEAVYVLLDDQQPVFFERRRLLRGFFTAAGFCWFVRAAIVGSGSACDP